MVSCTWICLPFGLWLAPKMFNAVVDALNWCLQQAGIRHVLHYLDDFIGMAPPGSVECSEVVDILRQVCRWLNVPLAAEKSEGPITALVFLGIHVDTVAGELQLWERKLERLKALLCKWGSKRACCRKRLTEPCMQGGKTREIFPSPLHWLALPNGG